MIIYWRKALNNFYDDLYPKDINECDITPCHQQATCNNSPGTYSCECNNGFSGNGTYCVGMGLTNGTYCGNL